MAKGIFPQMSVGDIANALSGWGLSVSSEQLARPSADFVEGVYCACLQQVTDINVDALRDPVQNALSASSIEEKDLYASALTNNLLVYHLTRLAKAARVEDFNAKDIYHPERERTLLLLSAFINFVKFTEQYCNAFVKDLRDRSEAIIIERDEVSQQLAEIEQSIAAMKAKIAEDEPRCEQLRNDNNALRAKMIATKEFQTAAVQEVEKLKAEKNALVKRKEALNGEIASVSDAITRTRSRIVQSPERIKRTITAMSTTAVEDKKTVAMQEAKARDLQAKINALLNIEKDLRSCIEQLQTIEKEVRSLQISQKELADLRDHLDDKKIERNELKLRQQRVEKQLSNAHDKLERAQRHAEEKKLASQRTIERLQREYDEMAIERRDNDKQVEELRAEANEVEKKMAEHLKKGEAELNELLAEYWKLRHETDVYMETLANKLNMRVTSG
ncbi:putative nuf2 family protein [Lyophyllum shimeji]|uniref:Nuf2 family protein n=1 Tax=Lyophyllum shimeji TaxID=47721 RepID=A0A9P3UIA9_LYOSH|nr:putative nuf2 family protein [Lyophyllum shimeji]